MLQSCLWFFTQFTQYRFKKMAKKSLGPFISERSGTMQLVLGDICEVDGGTHVNKHCIYLTHVNKKSRVVIYSLSNAFTTCIDPGNIKFLSRWPEDNGCTLADYDGNKLSRKALRYIWKELKDHVSHQLEEHQHVITVLRAHDTKQSKKKEAQKKTVHTLGEKSEENVTERFHHFSSEINGESFANINPIHRLEALNYIEFLFKEIKSGSMKFGDIVQEMHNRLNAEDY